MKKNKLIVAIMAMGLISVGVAARSSSASATDAGEVTRIGTVDMQRALQTVEAGKKAKSQLEKEFNAKKGDLQKEETAIKKLGEEFKKQSLVLNEDARMKKQGELQERIMKFQESMQRSQQEIQVKEQELTQPILLALKDIVSKLAKEKKYTVVLEKSENSVLFSQEKDDLTEQVIESFNKKEKGKS
ncbi:MAG: OmpH family outer membrane protein [Bdellovibrionota bacterium]